MRARTPAASVVQTLCVKLLVVGLALAAGVLTARTLGPAGRGDAGAIGLWPWLIAGLSTIGVPTALRYHASQGRDAGMLVPASVLALFAAVCGAIVGAVFIPVALAHRYAPSVIAAAQWMMIFIPIFALFRVFCAYYEARGDFTKSNASVLTSPAMTLIALVALALTHRLTPITANVATFGPLALQGCALGFRLRARLFSRQRAVAARLQALASYGMRSYGSDVLTILSVQADQAVIVGFLSSSALGVYAVALAASRALNIFVDSLNTVLFPTASRAEPQLALDMVLRAARLSSIVSGAAVAIFVTIAPSVVTFFYGPAFRSAGNVARILAFEAFLRGQSSVLLQGFLATNRPGTMTVVQGLWLGASLASLTVLVPRMGIEGAAYALVFSSLFRLIVILACYPLVLGKPMPNLVPRDHDFRYLVAKLVRFAHA